ncbi:hypothetical protein ABTK34_19155, partial [Acinetobacter baumannii]
MHLQNLGDLPADGQHRVERRHRFLEDHCDIATAPAAHLDLREHEQLVIPEANPTRDNTRG